MSGVFVTLADLVNIGGCTNNRSIKLHLLHTVHFENVSINSHLFPMFFQFPYAAGFMVFICLHAAEYQSLIALSWIGQQNISILHHNSSADIPSLDLFIETVVAVKIDCFNFSCHALALQRLPLHRNSGRFCPCGIAATNGQEFNNMEWELILVLSLFHSILSSFSKTSAKRCIGSARVSA